MTEQIKPVLQVFPVDSQSNEKQSVALVLVNGINKEVINTYSDTKYEVISGSGTFYIDGVERKVKAGDIVFIPKDVPYYDIGEQLYMRATSTPPFDSRFVLEL